VGPKMLILSQKRERPAKKPAARHVRGSDEDR
jgi:hypothetical protein